MTERKEVVKKGTMPNTNKDNFNSLPSLVNNVKMNIKPVKVKYLHFTMNSAMVLKKGITDKYANNNVMMIEYNIAFKVSAKLTSMLSNKSLEVSNCTKAVATLPGLGIKPSEVICHAVMVMITCSTIIMMSVCLLMWPNGWKMLRQFILLFEVVCATCVSVKSGLLIMISI